MQTHAGPSNRTDERLRVAFIGWGAIARTAAQLLEDTPVDIVAVAVRDPASTTPRENLPPPAQLVSDAADLLALRPDVVAEAASRDSVGPWGLATLRAGVDFVVSSVSALADSDLLDALRSAATQSGAQVHVQPGALAGVDALSAARSMGLKVVEHRIIKPPIAWSDTPAEELCDLNALSAPVSFFRGSASETASQFPKNANVAMTTALAGIGPERTRIVLVADPAATKNRHEVDASGDFGHFSVVVSNNALPTNPKTSAMAALSLVRAIQNRVVPIVL